MKMGLDDVVYVSFTPGIHHFSLCEIKMLALAKGSRFQTLLEGSTVDPI